MLCVVSTAASEPFDVQCVDHKTRLNEKRCFVHRWSHTAVSEGEEGGLNITLVATADFLNVQIFATCPGDSYENLLILPSYGQYLDCNGTMDRFGHSYTRGSEGAIPFSCSAVGRSDNSSSLGLRLAFNRVDHPHAAVYAMSGALSGPHLTRRQLIQGVKNVVGGNCLKGLKFMVKIKWPPVTSSTSSSPTASTSYYPTSSSTASTSSSPKLTETRAERKGLNISTSTVSSPRATAPSEDRNPIQREHACSGYCNEAAFSSSVRVSLQRANFLVLILPTLAIFRQL